MFPYILQGSNLTVVIDSKPYTINKTHITFEKVKEAIMKGAWDAVRDLVEPKTVVLKFGAGNITIDGESFLWRGQPMHNAVATRMVEMLKEGFDVTPLANFMHNLMQNPSYRSVTELYGFLEKNNLPITPDGHFLAYKKVRQNYFDVHSGKMDNSVGKVVEMERNMVDDKAENTCSYGLHFCSYDYLKHFGGERIVIVKINPRDVVSIPVDYNNAKGRACRYEVIGEIGADADSAQKAFTAPVQSNASNATKVAPKKGSSDFFRGYSAGYAAGSQQGPFDSLDPVNPMSGRYVSNYAEGYEKGYDDAFDGLSPRYEYVAKHDSGAWPFPV